MPKLEMDLHCISISIVFYILTSVLKILDTRASNNYFEITIKSMLWVTL